MYDEFADWFHLITAPSEYVEEAGFYLARLKDTATRPVHTLLELGSGGGNNAFHYKRELALVVLSDISRAMLEVSQRINPELDHVHGDMRALRLGRTFNAVLAHDAISYMTSEADLEHAMRTAFVHLEPGGAALFAPDHTRENFAARTETDCGGNDGDDGRAVRYLEWTYDSDPNDSTYAADYAFILHAPGEPARVAQDTHTCGLFSRATWLELMQRVGFTDAHGIEFEHSEVPAGALEVFVGRRAD
jgi:hypothetical protein